MADPTRGGAIDPWVRRWLDAQLSKADNTKVVRRPRSPQPTIGPETHAAGKGLRKATHTEEAADAVARFVASGLPAVGEGMAARDAKEAFGRGDIGVGALTVGLGLLPFAGSIKNIVKSTQPFYSRLERAIDAAPFEKGTAAQWRAALSKNVAAGEREWTGVEDFIKSRELTGDAAVSSRAGQPITKAQLREVMEGRHGGRGRVQLEETQLGGSVPLKQDGRNDIMRVVDPNYRSYTLPDGTNYRELLMQLPPGPREGSLFESSHWDEPNVLVHLRMNDRGTKDDRTLFLEELQSDWHQQGREVGYQPADLDRQIETARRRFEDARAEAMERYVQPPVEWLNDYQVKIGDDTHTLARISSAYGGPDKWELVVPGETPIRRLFPQDAVRQYLDQRFRNFTTPELAAARSEFNKLLGVHGRGVPSAPFSRTEDWMGLGLKRALREAAEGDYARLGWTTGRDQAERYDLAKEFDRLEWRDYATTQPGFGALQAYRRGSTRPVISEHMAREKLPAYIGQDYARRLLEQPGSTGGEQRATIHELQLDQTAVVGGEGMRTFYDKLIPTWLANYGKKMGYPLQPYQAPLQNKTGSFGHMVDLPPEFKRKILEEGQPLWGALFAAPLFSNREEQNR